MGGQKLNQRDVNAVHGLSAQGMGAKAIGERFGVGTTTIYYVLKSREPTPRGREHECARCSTPVGTNRVRIVAGHKFCVPCHAWVFEHPLIARHDFKGIF